MRTPVVETLDPGAYATYDVVRKFYDGVTPDEVLLTTSDRFKAYNTAGRWHKEDGLQYDVNSRPSLRYLREGEY